MQAVTYIEIDVPTFVVQSPPATETYRFAIPTSYLPSDIDAIPSIDSVSFSPARISLGEDLGQRASLSVTLHDHLHVFADEAYEAGTFWGKWRGRYGTKLSARPLRLIRGVVGQSIAEMDTRHYVIESTDGPRPDGTYTIEAKDLLKFADDDRAQAPMASNGSLAGSVSSVAGVAYLSPSGIGNAEYPASGYVCLGGTEVCAFTRSGDTLTITRGQFGSNAQEHESGDRVQLTLRYSGNDVADIIYDLLVNYASVPAGYITLADWQAETAAYLGVIYAATITEPTAVKKLLSELIEQAALAIWWDDRAQQIRLNVLREIATDTATFDEDQIIEGSLQVQEQPDKRISQIWTFYGQRDPTDRTAGEDNFRAGLLDTDLALETEYGSAKIKKVTARWVETVTAATRLNSLQLSRYRDPPRQFNFDLITGTNITPAAGYMLSWWGSQTSDGTRADIPIQITQVSISSDRIHIEAEEMLASGVVVLQHCVILSANPGSLLTYTRPATWNNADNGIRTIGAGAGGWHYYSGAGGGGGGGGAYSAIVNYSMGATVSYQIGVGGGENTSGGDTWFGATTYGASSVAAKGGSTASGASGGAGGQASAGIGTVRYSGGDGGNGAPQGETRAGGGGGGGAGGPNGNGAQGGDLSNVYQDSGSGGGGADGGYNGGADSLGGDNRFSFGGGNGTTPNGDEGGGGLGGPVSGTAGNGGDGEQIWTQTVAPIVSAGPGGGGGGGGSNAAAGHGGFYGGGGGGSHWGTAGSGRQGAVIITWTEA
jgi:hypothetical protein